jgi:N-ethylmaleimide reductase
MNRSFTPVRVGRYTLPNRLVTAMTCSRAKFGGTPGELAAECYAQRAASSLSMKSFLEQAAQSKPPARF